MDFETDIIKTTTKINTKLQGPPPLTKVFNDVDKFQKWRMLKLLRLVNAVIYLFQLAF